MLRSWHYEFVERWKIPSRAVELKQQHEKGLVIQVLFKDIFSVLFSLDRRFLYDPACLELLDWREWTSPWHEQHNNGARKLYMFEKAIRKYNWRIKTKGLSNGLGYTVSEGAKPNDDDDDDDGSSEGNGQVLRRTHSW